MKSQPKEHTIKTSCKNCAFAVYSDKTQISCEFDRISKFKDDVIEAYDNDCEFYLIDRLCTFYRDKAWGYSVSDKDKVQKESAIGFDVIFNCDNINATQAQIITHFINSNKYYIPKTNIVLIHRYDNYSDVKIHISNIAKSTKNDVNITMCDNIENTVHQLVLKSRNGYHCLVNHPELLETNTLTRLNHFVNYDLNKLFVANVNGIEFIGNFAYKVLYHTNNNPSYKENIDLIINDCKEKDMYTEI